MLILFRKNPFYKVIPPNTPVKTEVDVIDITDTPPAQLVTGYQQYSRTGNNPVFSDQDTVVRERRGVISSRTVKIEFL